MKTLARYKVYQRGPNGGRLARDVCAARTADEAKRYFAKMLGLKMFPAYLQVERMAGEVEG